MGLIKEGKLTDGFTKEEQITMIAGFIGSSGFRCSQHQML